MKQGYSALLTAPHCINDDFDFLSNVPRTQAVLDARTPNGRASGTIDVTRPLANITITINAEKDPE